MKSAQRKFAPSPLVTLGAVLLIVVFASLGNWQLRRADQAQALETAMMSQRQLAPIDLNRVVTLQDDLPTLLWRPATARGRWNAGQQVLLDNQMRGGKVGYLVFTPLRLDGCSCAVLVDRGWVAAPAERGVAPQVELTDNPVSIHGVLAPVPPSGLGVKNDLEQLTPGLLRVQRLDLQAIPSEPGVRLLPLTLRLDPGAPDGYERNWPKPRARADRHVAYAVQWFVFALITAGLYVGLNFRRPPRYK